MMLNTTTLKWSLYILKSISKILCVTSPNANDWPSMSFGYTRYTLFFRFLIILYMQNLWSKFFILLENTTILEYVHYFLINISLSSLFRIEHFKHL
jgi:hypothetical protein